MQDLWNDEVHRLNPPPLSEKSIVSDTSIRLVEDFPFPLLRHWGLYYAMLHSKYLCTRLRLYTAKGRSRLDNLLAKMGISRDFAKQAWTHVPRDLKKTLKDKLAKVETGLGLELVQGKTFERGAGYKGSWSVNDVVNVIEAILVCTEIRGSGKENVLPRNEGKEDGMERFRQREGEMKMEWVTRFWKALDAVDKFFPTDKANVGLTYYLRNSQLRNIFRKPYCRRDSPSLRNAR
jgi:cell division control protein 45